MRWQPASEAPAFRPEDIAAAAARVRETLHLVRHTPEGSLGVAFGGATVRSAGPDTFQLEGTLPPLYPEWLGDATFLRAHRARFPYVAGEMAKGIATPAMVIAAARAGHAGLLRRGGARLSSAIEPAVDEIQSALSGDSAAALGRQT